MPRDVAAPRPKDSRVDYFAAHDGPILKAFESVGTSGAPALRADLIDAMRAFERSEDDTLVLQQDYREVVAHKL